MQQVPNCAMLRRPGADIKDLEYLFQNISVQRLPDCGIDVAAGCCQGTLHKSVLWLWLRFSVTLLARHSYRLPRETIAGDSYWDRLRKDQQACEEDKRNRGPPNGDGMQTTLAACGPKQGSLSVGPKDD